MAFLLVMEASSSSEYQCNPLFYSAKKKKNHIIIPINAEKSFYDMEGLFRIKLRKKKE